MDEMNGKEPNYIRLDESKMADTDIATLCATIINLRNAIAQLAQIHGLEWDTSNHSGIVAPVPPLRKME